MAQFFGVDTSRFAVWDKQYPSFKIARGHGRVEADAQVVASFHAKAHGMTVKKQQAVKLRVAGKEPGQFTEEVQIVDLLEEVPPDTNAAALWLANRHPDKWKLKPGAADDGVNVGVTINITGGLPDE
jgi:hypothetical protein